MPVSDSFTKQPSFKAAIHNYARAGNLEGVEKELAKGININLKNKDGLTPLMYASANGAIDTVKELLENSNINVNIQNEYGDAALDLAKKYNYQNIAKMIEDYIQKIDRR